MIIDAIRDFKFPFKYVNSMDTSKIIFRLICASQFELFICRTIVQFCTLNTYVPYSAKSEITFGKININIVEQTDIALSFQFVCHIINIIIITILMMKIFICSLKIPHDRCVVGVVCMCTYIGAKCKSSIPI